MAVRVIFMGSASFAVPSLLALINAEYDVALVVTREDKRAGRGLALSETPVKQAALARGLRLFQPPNLRGVASVLAEVRPDLVVVAAYGRILPADVLAIPPRLPGGAYGCLNVHASLLPRWRGAAPIQWSILQGDSETGVSIMSMDEGLDTGPVLASARTPIRAADTAATLLERLAAMGAELLVRTIPLALAGDMQPVPQDETLATFAPALKKDFGAIDWSLPWHRVSDLVRGLEPWPGAYTFTPTRVRLRIFPFLERVALSDGVPGQILAIERHGMVVRCGDDSVRIAVVQPAGSRRMTPWEVAAGRRIAVGDVLGGR